jgi:hypothetical protein
VIDKYSKEGGGYVGSDDIIKCNVRGNGKEENKPIN